MMEYNAGFSGRLRLTLMHSSFIYRNTILC
jgi:hypothetical protein